MNRVCNLDTRTKSEYDWSRQFFDCANMKTDWRRKISIDWPCALGDWLWGMLVVSPAHFLDRLTLKRVAMIAGLLVLVYGFGQVFALEIAVVFAADAMVYFDVLTAVMLISAKRRIRDVVSLQVHRIKELRQRLKCYIRRTLGHLGRRRRRAKSALAKLFDRSGGSDSEPGPALASHFIWA